MDSMKLLFSQKFDSYRVLNFLFRYKTLILLSLTFSNLTLSRGGIFDVLYRQIQKSKNIAYSMSQYVKIENDENNVHCFGRETGSYLFS